MTDFLSSSVGNIDLILIIALIGVAIIAGYIDTLVGGGGLITIPALLWAGVPPLMALGTNKLQACAGSGTASLTLLLKKQVAFAEVKWSMLTAFLGALGGAYLVQGLTTKTLEFLIPAVIITIVVYFVLTPKPSSEGGEATCSEAVFRSTAVPAVGFYDGMFGPATGSFFVLAGVSLRGQPIVRASMTAKTLNFATNVAALLVFIWFGQVAFIIGVIMMIGQFVGASLGARTLMKIDPNKLRSLVVLMCLIMLVAWLTQGTN